MTTIKNMGRRETKYKRDDFLKEIKIYKQLLKANDPEFEIFFTGYVYLKELNILDFKQLQKSLKRKSINKKEEQKNLNIPEKYFTAGKECLKIYGLSYKDINNFYYFKEVENIFYKKDFLKKIKEKSWREFYENKFYLFDNKIDFEKDIEVGFIKKKYTIKSFFDEYKIAYSFIKEFENKKPEMLRTALTGFCYKEEKNIFPFNYLKEKLYKTHECITNEFIEYKIPEYIFTLGKECLELYGIDYEDINSFYSFEKLRENSFKRFLKKEVENEDWINYFKNRK